MTVNACLRGMVKRLRELWPGKEVYVDDLRQCAPGKCLVRCVDQSHSTGLGRRRKRSYGFEVLWFTARRDTMEFHDWAEQLYGAFETMDADGRLVRCGDQEAKDTGDGVWHFTFSAVLYPLLDAEAEDPMGKLTLEERVKDE